jgi:hypothetical protein
LLVTEIVFSAHGARIFASGVTVVARSAIFDAFINASLGGEIKFVFHAGASGGLASGNRFASVGDGRSHVVAILGFGTIDIGTTLVTISTWAEDQTRLTVGGASFCFEVASVSLGTVRV